MPQHVRGHERKHRPVRPYDRKGKSKTTEKGFYETRHAYESAADRARAAEMNFSDLPQDLAQMTPEQYQRVVDYLVTKPLKELRRRQDLVAQQQEMAFQQHNDRALENLHVMQDYLADAVDKKEFGG